MRRFDLPAPWSRRSLTARRLAMAAMLPLLSAKLPAEEIQFKLVNSGAMKKVGSYMPQKLSLAKAKPKGVKQFPSNLAAPLYGTLTIGPAERPVTVTVILDEPDDGPSRLFVDANANGDLTDDPAPLWASREVKGNDGKGYQQFSGGAKIDVPVATQLESLGVQMYRFDKRDPARAAQRDFLFYYPDFAREGEVTLGGKVYRAILADRTAAGDFRGKKGAPSGVQLFVDINGNGKFDGSAEAFDVRQPFNVDGQAYEIAGLTAGGESFRIEKSTKVVAQRQVPPPAEQLMGKPAKTFKAKTTDGKEIDFPTSYQGKLVLLDFWAMWCGPCIGELPHLTAAYRKFNAQGFEVLGISLDRNGEGRKLAQFTKEKNMPWPQVYDGGYWQARVATLYGVRSIPAAYLVDGDTGLVVATSGLRGTQLEQTIAGALARKHNK